MKLLFTAFIIGLFSFSTFCQTYFMTDIDKNNVRANMSSTGKHFIDINANAPGYEVPIGGGNQTIFQGSFWAGATDINDSLYLSATLFRSNGDIFSGPYSSNDSYNSVDYNEKYTNKVWKVTKNEIQYHIDNHQHPNYKMPWAIEYWPANGDASLGVSNDLAPFIDIDGNGVYNPENGDYPCIKGDAASFIIFNDDAQEHKSGGKKIGFEMHLMFYQFLSDDIIDTTTFVSAKIINKSERDYVDFRLAFYLDMDIGFAFDDYIGCDSTRNLGYTYNATDSDPGGASSPGYGDYPPAMGLKLLNKDAGNFVYYMNGGPSLPNTDPVTPEHYWGYMNSKWKDGEDFIFGGTGYPGTTGATTEKTNFVYSGNPYLNEGWTEMDTDGDGHANPNDEDKRFVLTAESIALSSGQEVEYDYALIYSGDQGYLENVNKLLSLSDDVQQFYNDEVENYDCIVQGTGEEDPSLDEDNIVPNNRLFEITRLDGEGNMSMGVYLHPDSEAQILQENSVDSIRYKRGKGPIYVERIDTTNYEEGYYVIKVLTEPLSESDWRIYQYDKKDGDLLDSLDANTTLLEGDTITISQWGLKIAIRQDISPCFDGQDVCPLRERHSLPVESSLEFDNSNDSWLSGVKSSLGFNQQNWITSGIFSTNQDPDPSLGVNDPTCYESSVFDTDLNYWNLVNGYLSPARLARHDGCDLLPIGVPESIISIGQYTSILHNQLATVFHPSIDIVFTSDKSKWTRCAVIELNNDETTSVGGALPGLLRQSPSVDKEGNPDGTGNGMSWFPGYAIDVETGRRLNMAFGENSTLASENGADMIWNPTSNLYDINGDAVLGGQHVIYVFGGEFEDMPAYDEGEFIETNLSSETNQGYQNVYRNLSWVMQPLLNEGHSLLETDARVSARVSKEFTERVLSNENVGKPMFGFHVSEFQNDVSVSENEIKNEPFIKAYPNPTNDKLNLEWKIKEANDIAIYSLDGRKVFNTVILSGQNSKAVDVSELNAGVYIVKIGNQSAKIIIGN